MDKSTQTDHYKLICDKLVAMRKAAGLTHRQLAAKLKREHSFVWRIEQGERRLDLVEFFWVCRALGQDPAVVYTEMVAQFAYFEPSACLSDQTQSSTAKKLWFHKQTIIFPTDPQPELLEQSTMEEQHDVFQTKIHKARRTEKAFKIKK
jgi:transcriptional regulator with XRE-family HTH domain